MMHEKFALKPFLQKSLGQHLTRAGFVQVKEQIHPFEYFRYERRAPLVDSVDAIEISCFELGDTWVIKAGATTNRGGKFVLPTVKELLPDFAMLPIRQNDRWEFSTQEELIDIVDELTRLFIGPLFEWFDRPVSNAAGLDMTLPQLYSDEENIAGVKQKIRREERELEKAIRSEDAHRIERIEGMLEGLRLALTELEGKKK